MVAVAVLKRTTMNVVQDSACNCELTKTPLCEPSGHAMEKKAAENYVIKFETTQGDFEVEVRRAWAPNGADRVFNLVRLGFFTNTAFYRTKFTNTILLKN